MLLQAADTACCPHSQHQKSPATKQCQSRALKSYVKANVDLPAPETAMETAVFLLEPAIACFVPACLPEGAHSPPDRTTLNSVFRI
jgi:hypothetical protein